MHSLIANVPPASLSFANVVDTAVMFAAGPVAVPLPVADAAVFQIIKNPVDIQAPYKCHSPQPNSLIVQWYCR